VRFEWITERGHLSFSWKREKRKKRKEKKGITLGEKEKRWNKDEEDKKKKKEFILYFLQSILHTLSFRSLPRVFPFSSTCFSLIVEKEFEKRKKEIKKKGKNFCVLFRDLSPIFCFPKKRKKELQNTTKRKILFSSLFQGNIKLTLPTAEPTWEGILIKFILEEGEDLSIFLFHLRSFILKRDLKKEKRKILVFL